MARGFNVLGPLEAVVEDCDVTPRAPRERSLLAMLILRCGHVVSADTLIDELWPDLPIDRARRALWVRIAGIRKLLDRAGASSLLETVPSGYRLAIDPEDTDVERFLRLTREARVHRCGGDPAATTRALADALALWRAEPLADAQGSLDLEAHARRLTDARLEATEDWIDAELACGHHDALLSDVAGLVAAHPERERLCAQYVACLTRSGRPGEALTVCRELRHRLVDELGVGPSPELVALEEELARPRPVLPRHNLPAETSRLVGRSAELQAVGELMRTSRLVTLTGVGGVGKTRLAMEAARAGLAAHPDGVWLVELAPIRDGAQVASAVCETLGMLTGHHESDARAALLTRYLAERRALLVLDNAEHLVDAVATLAHRLLASCPAVGVLVTSRRSLHLPGEAVFSVPPLSLPAIDAAATSSVLTSDAVALFGERGRAARAGFAVTTSNAAAVADVCRRLDGIPLAIELAAAHVRMLRVDQIATRLGQCFALLAVDAVAAVPERHRTTRAALDWSHRLLGPDDQVGLRRLAVFPGRFGLDAAVAVIEGEAPSVGRDGFAVLSRLVDASFVVVDAPDGGRFRLLEPIRQYAAERLAESGEMAMARRRLVEVLLARTDSLWPLISADDRRENYDDQESFRAALEWCWEQGDVAAALRLVSAQTNSWMSADDAWARVWLERLLAEPEPADLPARARAIGSLALNLHDSGERWSQRVDELYDAASALAERIGDRVEIAACSLGRVEVAMSRGNADHARQLTAAALDIYQSINAPAGVAWCHYYLGWIALAEHDHALARAHLARSTELARSDRGGAWLLAHTLAALAPLLVLEGERERGLRLADEAIAISRSFSQRAVLAMALARGAETAIVADETARAGELLGEMLALLRDLGTRRWAADALEMSAVVLERRGARSVAGAALAAAARLRAAVGEGGGAVRVVAAEVERSADRLRGERRAAELAAPATGPAAWCEEEMARAAVALRSS